MQIELGVIAGVTGNAISQWENGRSEPRMGAIERIAACYRISKSSIIEDDGMALIDPNTKKSMPPFPQTAIFPPPSRPAYTPLLGRVHAGAAQKPDIINEKVSVPYEIWERHQDAYLLEVEGNCMSRVI
ncbi:MAG: helix-turn-helix domain-containing protein [Raoultibacter sp.]